MRTQRDKIAVADQQLVEELEEQNQSTSVSTQVSERKQTANKQNAQKSTGPRTEDGKARSRCNALKHGLLTKSAVIEGYEDRKEFDNMLHALIAEFQPSSIIEEFLVERIADCYWNLGRIAAVKRAHLIEWLKTVKEIDSTMLNTLADGTVKMASKKNDEDTAVSWLQEHGWGILARTYLRLSGSCPEREVDAMSGDEAIRRLLRVKAESLKLAWPAARHILERQSDDGLNDEDFQKLHRYETTIENRLYKALHELERLQRMRGGQLVPAPLIVESNRQG